MSDVALRQHVLQSGYAPRRHTRLPQLQFIQSREATQIAEPYITDRCACQRQHTQRFEMLHILQTLISDGCVVKDQALNACSPCNSAKPASVIAVLVRSSDCKA